MTYMPGLIDPYITEITELLETEDPTKDIYEFLETSKIATFDFKKYIPAIIYKSAPVYRHSIQPHTFVSVLKNMAYDVVRATIQTLKVDMAYRERDYRNKRIFIVLYTQEMGSEVSPKDNAFYINCNVYRVEKEKLLTEKKS